ncbi:MAG TPA: DUF302 domain-containing protein [Rhodanobacter sp.]
MYYIVETSKTPEQAAADLTEAVARNGFGVLHVHDLGATLRSKGVAFERQCKVFEVCNPQQAASVLAADMRLNMALPCRISVYADAGKTWIGMIRPVPMLGTLSTDPALVATAGEVEQTLTRIIDEAS